MDNMYEKMLAQLLKRKQPSHASLNGRIWSEELESYVTAEEAVKAGIGKERRRPWEQEEFDHLLLAKALGKAKKFRRSVASKRSELDKDKEAVIKRYLGLYESYVLVMTARQPLQKKWEQLRLNKKTWWSHFNEEVKAAWAAIILFDETTMEKWLATHELTPAEWQRVFAKRLALDRECYRKQGARFQHTNSIYKQAIAYTEKCKAFWKTPEGEELNELNSQRGHLLNAMRGLELNVWDFKMFLKSNFSQWYAGQGEPLVGDEDQDQQVDVLADAHVHEWKRYMDEISRLSEMEAWAMRKAGSFQPSSLSEEEWASILKG